MTQDGENEHLSTGDLQELRSRLIIQHAISAESTNGLSICELDTQSKGSTKGSTGGGASSNGGGIHIDDISAWDDQEGFEMHWPDDPDSTHPFTKAALDGDVSIIKEHVRKGTFEPNARKSHNALLAACRAGHLEIVKVLLDAGVDVHCKDSKSNWQPIHISAYRDHVAIVETLAMHGEWRRGVALVRFKGVTCSLLHLAAHFGCAAVLRYLLSHTVRLGLHIEVRDAAHWTALHHACFEGKIQTASLLIKAGADVNSADPHGVTPLHASAFNDHVNLVRLLLQKGSNPKMTVHYSGSVKHAGQHLRLGMNDGMPDSPAWRKRSLENLLPLHKRRCWSPSLPTTPDPATTGTMGRWKGHSAPSAAPHVIKSGLGDAIEIVTLGQASGLNEPSNEKLDDLDATNPIMEEKSSVANLQLPPMCRNVRKSAIVGMSGSLGRIKSPSESSTVSNCTSLPRIGRSGSRGPFSPALYPSYMGRPPICPQTSSECNKFSCCVSIIK